MNIVEMIMTQKFLLALLVNLSLVFGQDMKSSLNPGSLHPWVVEEANSDVGIVHHELNINLVDGLNSDSALYSMYQRITYRYSTAMPRSITFDAFSTLYIDSVRIKDNIKTIERTDQQLTVPLDPPDFTSDSCIIEIWYRYSGDGRRGFFYYTRSSETLERLAYTMTESNDSPYWFVTINDNRVKPTVAMNITVPSGFVAGANGILTGTTTNPDGTVVYHWREDHPVAMYLTAFAVSKYATYSDYYHRLSNPSDSVEIKYYVWNDDLNGETHSARACFMNVVDMMEYYSQIFGEYPFDKYGMVVVYPFSAGGMEHQTLTTIHRQWIRVQPGTEHGSYEGGIAHELVHQWYGDLITCETWADIWLNESFATYGEKLWQEHFYGNQKFKDLMRSTMNFNGGGWQNPIYVNPPPAYLFYDVVYDKGSWVLHMLRYVMGDSSFFTLLKSYATDSRYYYRTALTSQFTDLASQVAGTPLSPFFNQWLYHAGWPVYEYSSNQIPTENGYTVSVHLSQVQNDAAKTGNIPRDGTIFVMPVQMRCYMAGEDTLLTFVNTQETETFSFTMPQPVDSIVIDPDNRILKQFYQPQTRTDTGSNFFGLPQEFKLYQNYPNPFNPSTVIRYDVPRRSRITIIVANMLGQEVRRLVDDVREAGKQSVTWDGRSNGNFMMASGVYFITLRAENFYSTQKILLIR
jgi:aminopeptidase N